ncbi:MAG: ATP-binding cassette domain-containing protein [Bradymonadaceae bacterium]|nr:ATP-binding cassette domain-containing protein [Lujinxingiaceae bacterium]
MVNEEVHEGLAQPFGLRRLVSLALPHWRSLALATVSLVLGSGIALMYPQAARIVVDDVFGENATLNISTVGFALLGLFLFQSVLVSVRYYLFTVVGDRVVADLRQRLFRAIVERDMGFFDATKTGELTSRLSSDTQILQSAVTTNLSMALRFGMQAAGGIIVLFVTSVKLSLVILILLPVIFTIAMFYGRRVRKLSREVQEAVADSTSLAEEALAGIRTVRSFAREEHEALRYDGAIERSFNLAKHRSVLGAFFGGGISFLGYAAIAVILWFGSIMVMGGEMTPGELTAYILYVLFVAFSVGVLSGLWTDFAKAVGSGERVFALIDACEAERAQGPRPSAIPEHGEVVFENVSFTYPTRPNERVLTDVSFTVRPGQRLALVGASGSGKSTIANLLSRFYEPEQGTIRIDGRATSDYDPTILRRHVGMVAQEPILFSGTVEENVLYGRPEATQLEVIEALKAANAWDFIQSFPEGLDTVVGERGVRLSGGQKQRVAIARALLKDPVLLILDEATSALDVESESLVQKALERLMEGRTTVIIAHRLSTIANADGVIVLERGKLIEQGTHEQLMARRAAYYRMVELQMVGT